MFHQRLKINKQNNIVTNKGNTDIVIANLKTKQPAVVYIDEKEEKTNKFSSDYLKLQTVTISGHVISKSRNELLQISLIFFFWYGAIIQISILKT